MILNLNLKTCLQIAINFYEKLKRQKKKKKGTSERESERASERERKQIPKSRFIFVQNNNKKKTQRKRRIHLCSPGRSSGVGAPRGEGRPRGPRGLRERPCSRCRPGARGGAPTPGPYTPHAPSFYSKALTVTRGRHPPPPTSDPHKGPALAEPQATDGGRGREGARAPRPPPAYATPGVGPRERARCPAETPAPRASRGLGAPSSVTSVLLVLFFFFFKGKLAEKKAVFAPSPARPPPRKSQDPARRPRGAGPAWRAPRSADGTGQGPPLPPAPQRGPLARTPPRSQ